MTWHITVYAPTKASIVKDLSKYPDGLGGVIYNGRPLEPNKEHPVLKGSTIEYYVMAVRTQGTEPIWLRLLVNGSEVDRATGTTSAVLSGALTADRDMTIRFEAGHGSVKDDEWGC